MLRKHAIRKVKISE